MRKKEVIKGLERLNIVFENTISKLIKEKDKLIKDKIKDWVNIVKIDDGDVVIFKMPVDFNQAYAMKYINVFHENYKKTNPDRRIIVGVLMSGGEIYVLKKNEIK